MEVVKEMLKNLITFAENWGELIIASLAFIVSVIAIIKSSKAEKLQNKINKLELQIKQNEVEQINKAHEEASYSCVEARVITIGEGKHRMKVWNSGNAKVYNITASFDGEPGIIIMDQEKQPFDELDSGKNYELVLVAYGQCNSKFRIITEWEDKDGKKYSKMQMGDL